MKPHASSWFVIIRRNGVQSGVVALQPGVSSIGRDASCTLPLPDSSVSRRHAELELDAGGLALRDLGSRNGVQINGAPRRQARLQAGDRLTVCSFELEISHCPPSDATSPARPGSLEACLAPNPTIDLDFRLPDDVHERHLAALYHLCFWMSEGLEEGRWIDKTLRLLRECFHSSDAQLYDSDLTLKAFVSDTTDKPSLKLGGYLGKLFQETPEARMIRGSDHARHQRGVGDFNFLVCPIESGAGVPHPFLVMMRSKDLEEFSREERVLLQAMAHLWVRGSAQRRQFVELKDENQQLRVKAATRTGMLVGSAPAMIRLADQARRVAATHATVLITGETGSGKEVLAQFIHDESPRRRGPLIKMNCAAIPDSLMESELFGYEKGAFSGAIRDHAGKFVQADGGTLFLDEIGDMPLQVQAKVLRAIENREIQPLGSSQSLKPDIRIIAATHMDLAASVRKKEFREDLYYRLDVQGLRVPALRERSEDLGDLADRFLNRFCDENGLGRLEFGPDALERLRRHDWPGNIRELWNVVQRCALNASARMITAAEVDPQIRKPG